MKKIISLILALVMIASVVSMTACENESASGNPTEAPTEPEPEIIPETPYALDCFRINGVDISEYVIVSNTAAGGVMTTAATELQKYIELTCGAKLDIVEGTLPTGTKRILIDGEVRNPDDNDTWGVYSDEDGLVLAGTAKRSALYAVYYFLEHYLDWRFFTSDCETVYEHSLIDLKEIDDTFTHQYKVRGLYCYDYSDSWISVKRYFNESSMRNLPEELGGMEYFTNMGIHNFWMLNEDPDHNSSRPCLNDPATRERMLGNIRKFLDAYSTLDSIHVSQNDGNWYCECADCTADIEYYGAPSGVIIEFLNYVCEDLETYKNGAYKDVLIITFAYQYSFTAPENIVCHDNIVIEYTFADLCHQHSILNDDCVATDDKLIRGNQNVIAQIDKWKMISKQCLVYDYGLNTRYYYSPYPDFDTLRENYAYFASLNPWGYMNLSNPHQNGCDFSEMRFYLYAKLLQYPYMTEEEYNTHIDEFISAYYGDAAPYIKEYFEFTQRIADEHDQCYEMHSSPEQMWGNKVFGSNSDYLIDLFNKALTAASGDEASLTRVRRLWVGMEYLRIGDLHTKVFTSREPDLAAQEAITAEITHFWDEIRDLGLTWVWESGQIPERINNSHNPRKLFQWLHQFYG